MALVVAGTDFIQMPAGTTAQRPVTPAQGMQRYNTDLGYTEIYTGAAWVAMGTQGAVASLNGLTGALNGLTFISTTSIANGSTSTDVTGIPSGYKQIFFAVDYSMNTTSSATIIGLRISTNNGSSYIATGYFTVEASNFTYSFINNTGSGTSAPRVSIYGFISQPNSSANMTPIISFGGNVNGGGILRADTPICITSDNTSYVNAIQVVRVSGTRLFTGGSISLWGQK